MTPESILLSIRDRSGEGSYSFSCPTCLHTIEKPADRKVAALLLSAGVEVADEAHRHELFADPEPESFEEPPPPMEPLEHRPGGPLFTADDLITFHFLLQDDEALYRLLPRP